MKAFLPGALLAASFLTLAAPPSIANPQASARSEYRRLVKEYAQATKEYEQSLAELREAGDKADIEDFEQNWHPNLAYVELFEEAAAERAGTDGAITFLEWIVKYDAPDDAGLPAACSNALTTLLTQHADSKAFRSTIDNAGFLAYEIPKVRVLAILSRVIEHNDPELKPGAYFSRGVAALIRRDATESEKERAKKDLLAAQELVPDSPLSKSAGNYIFELEHLQIGQVAPDIEGVDLDGVPFKLSDYRGKVVFLDFWGDW
jgi:hypothetical protein